MPTLLSARQGIGPSRWSQSTRVIATALVAILVGAGCATSSTGASNTLDNQVKHVAHVRVESSPPGGTLFIGDQPKGTTPTTVDLPYAVSHERVVAHKRRYGGGLVGLALGAFSLLGSAPFYWLGKVNVSDNEPAGSAYSTAIALSIIGLIGMGLGIWGIATAFEDQQRAVPHSFEIGLRTPAAPGLHTVHIETTDEMGRFNLLETLRFNAKTRRWWAPGEPAGIALTMRTEPELKAPKPATATSQPATKAPTTSQPTTRPHAMPSSAPSAQEPGIEPRTNTP